MCGICGFAGFSDEGLLHRMTDALSHRGLDDKGHFVSADACLGFRRLSIIDLALGNQPLANENKSVWSVCNGEIYNFREIKDKLLKKGHIFHTQTDTEILPHAYEEWGIDLVRRLNGMFAFALWDAQAKKLFLVRDRLGIRPLHYAVSGGKIIFASEAKAILRSPDFKKELDYGAMDDFLTLRYIPGDVTFFKNIKILEPAHILIFQAGNYRLDRYWDVPMEEGQGLKEKSLEKKFYELLDLSVKRCLISDVPLGVYLSGGLDSSVIASLVKKNYDQELVVFSHGFDEREDELRYARAVAKFLQAKHYEVFIQDKHLELLPEIIYHMDMPIANSDIIGFYLLASLAHQHVKVFLTGEGSDELFGSYVHQEALYYGYQIKKFIPALLRRKILPWLIKSAPLGAVNSLFRYPGYGLDEESRRKISDYFAAESLSDDYFCLNSLFSQREKAGLYSRKFMAGLKDTSLAKENLNRILDTNTIKNIFNRLIYLEFKYWLPTYHLMKEDKIAMSYCLESRYPYLDHEIVEFMGRLPIKLKNKGLKRKYLLRRISTGMIPEQIRNRQKGPILVPINKCFQHSFGEQLERYFSESSVEKRGYFNYGYIRKLICGRKTNPFLYDRQLFALLTLEIWHNIFIDK